jgi:hypothetical protein
MDLWSFRRFGLSNANGIRVGQYLTNCRWLSTLYLRHNRHARQARTDTLALSKKTYREGHTMAKRDGSKKDGSALERAQYEYGKMIYLEGLKILETFAEAVIGRDPSSGGERMLAESGGGAPSGARTYGAPPGQHISGSPPGMHINIYVPLPPCPPVTDGAPPGQHIYGSPPGWHINFGPSPGGPVPDGAPPGWHINAIIKLAESVLCLKPPK